MEFVNQLKNDSIIENPAGNNDNSDIYISNDINVIRTNDTNGDSSKDTNSSSKINSKDIDGENDDNNISIGIYRYKFTNEFTEELFRFSKIHQYDHRKDFKEAWEIWMEDNSELIDCEMRRLNNLGYDGNVIEKMFKSARYYFRKKSTEKKEPAKRRIYVGSQKELLDAMDNHIKSNIISGDFKPSDGFDDFCIKNINLLKDQIAQFCNAGIKDPDEIKYKIKKTYKNRYFLFSNK